jgi:hypothetical protein
LIQVIKKNKTNKQEIGIGLAKQWGKNDGEIISFKAKII